ncbi:hypothetical protein [Acinetobacter sp. YH01026]|uniref:hypothetical protein n=1 Tax=Acinetobacter sp. YH01026 TaxID=2601039 RepID=UPI0015D252C4|nr:hypothetical protein [Acinetobacter sp. YH01026]
MLKKFLATWIACFILFGWAAIDYWRDIQYQPELTDLIAYFLVVPMLISAALFAPWFIYQVYQHYKMQRQQASQTEFDSAQFFTTAMPHVDPQYLKLHVYAAAAYSALGENEAILEGIQHFTSPKLDRNLLNLHGLPMLSYRIEDLDQQHGDGSAHEQDESCLSLRQQRIMALIQQQIEQHITLLSLISAQLKCSSLFYESQHLHEYRMHPAWTDLSLADTEQGELAQLEQVYRLDRLNLHILLSAELVDVWDDSHSNTAIQRILDEMGIILEKIHLEYHYLRALSAEQELQELFERIQHQAHEIALIIVVDSEIDQVLIDEKCWINSSYLPAEFISSWCVANTAVQLEQQRPIKAFNLFADQAHVQQIFEILKLRELALDQAEAPFVFMLEDATDRKAMKKCEQFFAESPVEPYHYLYCKPAVGNTLNLAKPFGLMLGALLPSHQAALVYTQNLQACIQTFSEIPAERACAAFAD